MSTTVAFIVDAKNEEDTVRLATAFKSQLNAAKVVATRTEKNKLEGVVDKKSIVFATSLDVQGEKTISAKASRGEVNLLVYLNPPVGDDGMLPRFVDLLQQSLKKHTLIALNYETAETILHYMACACLRVAVFSLSAVFLISSPRPNLFGIDLFTYFA